MLLLSALPNPRVLPSLQGRRDELEKKYEAVQRWMLGLRSLTGSEYTIKHSLNAMLHYCDWTGKDPDALISERIQDLKQDDVRIRGRHEDLALKYFQTIKSRGSGVNTLAYLKSFYRYNYVPLQCKVPQRWRVTSEKVPTQGEIRKMMSVSDMRDRAMIAFLAQSGVRDSTLCRLTYGDVSADLEAGKVPVHIKIMPRNAKGKEAKGYDTFIGPESVEALREYFDSRRKGTPYTQPERIHADSPLFRRARSNGNPNEILPINEDIIQVQVSGAAVKAGVIEPKKHPGEWSQVRPHCLRKFYQTSLERAGIPQNWVKRLLGHKLPKSEDPYSKPTLEDLRKAYERAIPHLALNDTTIELAAQQETIQDLRARLEKVEAIQVERLILAANPRGRPSAGARRRNR
jgi:integrase